ncbi:ABC-2 transporter permease [Paenibacillus xylaniclasticus]|uniref:ABC-2 transporter permease n=1 Tax=Paenibacillus xylaniclasticus TaxID=588083 RepID=UPI001FEBE657|nr:ABC-2 transporter permease [Paenibacillus xylaniclasticus]
MLIAAIALPVFIHRKITFFSEAGFLPFFLSSLYIIFLLFSTVSMMEDKYRGAAHLCATPYMRNAIVRSKYLFIIAIFVGCYIIYTLTALFSPIKISMLSLSDIGQAFFIITIVFGVIIPVQYRFGYDKSRYILFFLIFLTPFVLPSIVKLLQNNGVTVGDLLSYPQSVTGLLLVLIALIVGFISLRISTRIYSNTSL